MGEASKEEEERFSKLCERIRRECFSDGQDELQKAEEASIASTVLAAIRKHFDAPPTAALEVVLGRNCVDAMARQVLFFPQPEDMDFWPHLLGQAPDGAPKDHPQTKALTAALPIFYMRHSRDWALCRPFILAGGLAALSYLLVHENLYLRSQALESLSRLTDQSVHLDWLDSSDHENGVRLRLFQLSQGTLVQNLLMNRKGSYPGGSGTALRCLAFFLSWLRHMYTKEKVLYVRKAVLDAFKEWQTLEATPNAEKELAKTLLEDFGRWPSIEERAEKEKEGVEALGFTYKGDAASSAVASVGGAEWRDCPPLVCDEPVPDLTARACDSTNAANASSLHQSARSDAAAGAARPVAAVAAADAVAATQPVAAASALPPPLAATGAIGSLTSTTTAEDLKREGNELLKAGSLAAAEAKYSEALLLAREEREDALIYSNRALVRLQLNAYEKACQDCDAALAIDPSLAKALTSLQSRAPSTLESSESTDIEATERLKDALASAQRALQLLPKDGAVEGLCKKIRRELALHKAAAKAADVDELD